MSNVTTLNFSRRKSESTTAPPTLCSMMFSVSFSVTLTPDTTTDAQEFLNSLIVVTMDSAENFSDAQLNRIKTLATAIIKDASPEQLKSGATAQTLMGLDPEILCLSIKQPVPGLMERSCTVYRVHQI